MPEKWPATVSVTILHAMPTESQIAALLRDLASSDMDVRVRALSKLETSGTTLVPELAACLASDQASEKDRVGAAIALCTTGDDEKHNARTSAIVALLSRSAAVRRACIEALAVVGDDTTVDVIAAHLDDQEVAPTTAFEDARSVAEAARSALRAMNTAPALAALARDDSLDDSHEV